MAEKRALTTTQPRRRVTRNNESMWRMMRAKMKRARVARAVVMAMRVPDNKEGEGGKGNGIGKEGGMGQRGQ